ncbi:MAG: hypothetical protein WCL18_01975 [bacterium]
MFFGGGVFLGTITVVGGETIMVVVQESIGESSSASPDIVVHDMSFPVSRFSCESVISRSKSSSSPVISCKPQVSCKIVPVISITVQVTRSVVPLREKCVPIVLLENDFKSYKRFFAAAGLIMR